MDLKTYYDFALDDYRFLCELKKTNITANSIGAIAQNTCERFLKHLINEFVPVTEENRQVITDILTTHNLNNVSRVFSIILNVFGALSLFIFFLYIILFIGQ